MQTIRPQRFVYSELSPEASERKDLDFVHPEDLTAVAAYRAQFLSGAITEGKLAFRLLHSDGGEVWVESSTRALFDAQTHASDGYVSSIRDVSERVQLAAERERREHDLRAANIKLESLAKHLIRARDGRAIKSSQVAPPGWNEPTSCARQAVAKRHPDAAVIMPPRAGGVASASAVTAPTQRDRHPRMIAEGGRISWQRAAAASAGQSRSVDRAI